MIKAYTLFYSEKLKEKDNLRSPSLCVRVILKWILEKYYIHLVPD
jgi:hypothetical protein